MSNVKTWVQNAGSFKVKNGVNDELIYFESTFDKNKGRLRANKENRYLCVAQLTETGIVYVGTIAKTLFSDIIYWNEVVIK